jgi:hypothetical protein
MNEILGMKLMYDMDPNCQRIEEGQMQKLIAMKKQSEAESSKVGELFLFLFHSLRNEFTKLKFIL